MPLLVDGLLDSATSWSIAFLLASGLTVVFGMLGFLNVAHTAFAMLAAYIAYSVATATGSFWAALLLAPPITTAAALAAEGLLLSRSYRGGHTEQLLLTAGLASVLGEAVKIGWGNTALGVPAPPSLSGQVALLGARLPVYHLFVIATTVVVLGVLALVLTRTRLGVIVRAASVHPDMVAALGFPVRRIHAVVFAVGAALASLAGVIMTPMVGAYPSMANDTLVKAFIVVVAGGLGSLRGAFLAAGLIGLAEGLGDVFASAEATYLPFVVLGSVLLVRPSGLFRTGDPS